MIGHHELEKKKKTKCFKDLKRDPYNLSSSNYSVNLQNQSFREGIKKCDKNLKFKPFIRNYQERSFRIKLDED